ncbi:hypothetical protein D9M73_174470 [compost metagenome]
MAQYTDPHRRRTDDQRQGADQAGQAAVEGATGGQATPVHGHDQDREICRGGDAERQADQEGDVLAFEQNAEGDRDNAQADGGDARHAHFLLLVGLALLEDRGIKVVGDGRGAGQGQPGHHCQDGGEGNRRDEAEEQVAAHRLGQVHGHHVAAADHGPAELAIDVVLRIRADDDDGGIAQDADHQEEETDKHRGEQYGFTRFLGIGHREEAHQDVRQAGNAEDQPKG